MNDYQTPLPIHLDCLEVGRLNREYVVCSSIALIGFRIHAHIPSWPISREYERSLGVLHLHNKSWPALSGLIDTSKWRTTADQPQSRYNRLNLPAFSCSKRMPCGQINSALRNRTKWSPGPRSDKFLLESIWTRYKIFRLADLQVGTEPAILRRIVTASLHHDSSG